MALETLEPRQLLASDVAGFALRSPSPDAVWFERLETAPVVSQIASPDFVGPVEAADDEWIVQLSETAIASTRGVVGVGEWLSSGGVTFDVQRGLGSAGLVLATSSWQDGDVAAEALQSNPHVELFSQNQTVQGTALPNDTEFVAGGLIGLQNQGNFGGIAGADVDAEAAWDVNTGDTRVVVGLIDSGVDADHVDLYQNIWLNQNEIPAAIASQLVDIDGDGLFTFYDLNDDANAGLVNNASSDNDYIDALDVLADPRWADGVDTDGNSYVDDFFGWNFRDGSDEPFAPNNPSDTLGHGTHIAGTIGAVGNNGQGVVGLNWRTSIMSLKFLDETNQGELDDAIEALNYARMMRTQYDVGVRVTNNSWGQAGSPNALLEQAIEASGEAGILFVAAAGNGNVLGQGVDIDAVPFFPASFDSPHIIAVAASDGRDELSAFTNFGANSVDLAAPGVGILSTLPGDLYGVANGTSMAVPHVTGTIALLHSDLPGADPAEIRRAILEGVVPIGPSGVTATKTATGGRLSASAALNSDIFSPVASLVGGVADVSEAGGTSVDFEVLYQHRTGIDSDSIGDDNIIVRRQWGPRDEILASVVGTPTLSDDETQLTVTYRITPPGGEWDALDFGSYEISTLAGSVTANSGQRVAASVLTRFDVRVIAPEVLYVDSLGDGVDANVGDGICATDTGACTLRAATMEANAGDGQFIVILEPGIHRLETLSHPIAAADSFTVDEDSSLTFPLADLVANDTSAEGTVSLFDIDQTSANRGRIAVDGDDVTYVPAANFSGTDTFTYKIGNGGGNLVTGTVTIEVAAINDPPLGTDDAFSVELDSTTTLDVLIDDIAGIGESGALTLESIDQFSEGGSAAIGVSDIGEPAIEYTPADGFVGQETFRYQIADDSGLTAFATATINVVDGLEQPEAVDDVISGVEDSSLVFSIADDLLANDFDDAGILQFVGFDLSEPFGTLEDLGDGTFRYTPAPDLTFDFVTYTITDGNQTSQAIVSFDLSDINDAPIASDATTDLIALDVKFIDLLEFVVAGPEDEEFSDEIVSIEFETPVDFVGTLTESVFDLPTEATVQYDRPAGFVGSTTFTYTATDAGGLTDQGEITIRVADIIADDDFATTTVNEPVLINVIANDAPVFNLEIPGSAEHGTLEIVEDEEFGARVLYTPEPGFVGTDTFTYFVGGMGGSSDSASVTIEVTDGKLVQLALDATQDGLSIVDDQGGFEVTVGERFDLEFLVTDLRDEDNRFGLNELYVDVISTMPDSFVPVLSETQRIVLRGDLSPQAGTIVVGIDGSDETFQVSRNQSAAGVFADFVSGISTFTDFAGMTIASDSFIDEDDGVAEFTFRFVDRDLVLSDVPNLTISLLADSGLTAETFEIPVYVDDAQTVLNPRALEGSLDLQSRTFGGDEVYGSLASGEYSRTAFAVFDDVGASLRGEPEALGDVFADQTVEAFSVPILVTRQASDVSFSLNLSERIDAVTLFTGGGDQFGEVAESKNIIVDDSPGGGGQLSARFVGDDLPNPPGDAMIPTVPIAGPFDVPTTRSAQSVDATGDLAIRGDIIIVGDSAANTVIASDGNDRVLKVFEGATLDLTRIAIAGGVAPADQDGGGILSAGELVVRESIIEGNFANQGDVSAGGGIAIVGGNAQISRSLVRNNAAIAGGGLLVSGRASVSVDAASFVGNAADLEAVETNFFPAISTQRHGGGAILSVDGGTVDVSNSTFSGNRVEPNRDPLLAIAEPRFNVGSVIRNAQSEAIAGSRNAVISGSGRFVAFESDEALVAGDTNNMTDVYLLNLISGEIELVSRTPSGSAGDRGSFRPSISDNGSRIAFESDATNLVAGDANDSRDVFAFFRGDQGIRLISRTADDVPGNGDSHSVVTSGDGLSYAFVSDASNLIGPVDSLDNQVADVFYVPQVGSTPRLVSRSTDFGGSDGDSDSPSLSNDGQVLVFESVATNLTAAVLPNAKQIYAYDVDLDVTQVISTAGGQGTGDEENGDAFEPNDSIGLADFLVVPESGSIRTEATIGDGDFGDTSGDMDFFAIDLAGSGDTVIIDVQASVLGSDLDPTMTIFDEFGVEVAFNDDTNLLDPSITFTAPAAGIYFVMVAAFGTETTQPFDSGTGQGADSIGFYDLVITRPAAINGSPAVSGDGSVAAFLTEQSLTLHDPVLNERIDAFDPGDFGFPEGSSFEQFTLSDDASVVAAVVRDPEGTGAVYLLDLTSETATQASSVLSSEELASLRPSFDAALEQVVFQTSAPISDQTPSGIVNVFVRDLEAGTDRPVVVSPPGSVRLDHVTVVDSFGFETLTGPVVVGNSLIAGSTWLEPVTELGEGVVDRGINVVGGNARASVSPLTQIDAVTFVHTLGSANPARGAANPGDSLPTDQLGNPRPTSPDIGAVQAVANSIAGNVFGDTNQNGRRELSEPGIVGTTVFLDLNQDGILSPGEPVTTTIPDDTATLDVFEDGNYRFDGLATGTFDVVVLASGFDKTERAIERINVASDGSEANGPTSTPLGGAVDISGDGRIVVFASFATNLAGEDTNGVEDIFIADILGGGIERIADAFDPRISQNGQYVVYTSGDEVFRYDRLRGSTRQISIGSASRADINADGNLIVFQDDSQSDIVLYDVIADQFTLIDPFEDALFPTENSIPSLSADGSVVAFLADDGFGDRSIVVYDVVTETVTSTIDLSAATNVFGPTFQISGDGSALVYAIPADGLLDGQRNQTFLVDLATGDQVELTRGVPGVEDRSGFQFGLRGSGSLSHDGSFVVFTSEKSNLVAGDTNGSPDVFVYDRALDQIRIAGLSETGDLGTQSSNQSAGSNSPVISGDGSTIVFVSDLENLVADDTNGFDDVFLVQNEAFEVTSPLPTLASLDVRGNQAFAGINFGLAPRPGSISGSVYQDIVANERRDDGEPGIADVTVFLDANGNSQLDDDELRQVTDSGGDFQFDVLPGEQAYQVLAIAPSGFAQVTPAEENGHSVFLSGGASVTARDFAFREANTDGQFTDGSVSGRIFVDASGDGIYQDGETGVADVSVYLDANNDAIRQFDEPLVVTQADDPATVEIDESGTYRFTEVAGVTQVVRILDLEGMTQTSPRGSVFAGETVNLRADDGTSLLDASRVRFTDIRDVETGDFDGDGRVDFALALYDASEVLVHLQQSDGTFDNRFVSLSVAPEGSGPSAIDVGDFNGNGITDIVVANSANDTATIFFDVATAIADQVAPATITVPVGESPIDVASVDFDNDGDLDFVVANDIVNEVSVVINDGAGGFAVASSVDVGGTRPRAIAVGDFDGDGLPDVAVANLGGSDFGNVGVLINDNGADLTLASVLQAGRGPVDIVAGRLDGDDTVDLAVANFLSDTVSVFAGAGDGSFAQTLPNLSAGTGPTNISLGDVDGDSDLDVLVSNLSSRDSQGVSILRNTTSQGAFGFEPSESFGLGKAGQTPRLPFVADDLTGDGVVDLVVANSLDDTVQVLRNTLVDGANRVRLDDRVATGIDFAIATPPSPIMIVEGGDQSVDLSMLDGESLAEITTIDLRDGGNTLTLDAATIRDQIPSQALRVISAATDNVVFDSGWEFDALLVEDGVAVRRFTQGDVVVLLVGPRDWQNPIVAADVDGSGVPTSLDALQIVNELAVGRVSDDDGLLDDAATVSADRFRFYDVDGNGTVSARDALIVINRLAQLPSSPGPEPELAAVDAVLAAWGPGER